jgi:hypothetical protein
LKVALSFRKIRNSGSKFLMKHIFPNSLFIQKVAKCIRTSNKISKGLGWKGKLPNMLQSVILVSKCDTWKLLVHFNLCLYHPGNGKTSVWTSLLVCPIHLRNTILYGLLLIGLQRPLLLIVSFVYTVYQRQLFLIMALSS